MTATRQRFPRESYAKRIAGVAEDMSDWVPPLLEYARGPDSVMHDGWLQERAEARAAVIQDIVRELQQLTVRIRAIR